MNNLIRRRNREHVVLPFRMRKENLANINSLDSYNSDNVFNAIWWRVQILQTRPWTVLYADKDEAATKLAKAVIEAFPQAGPLVYMVVREEQDETAAIFIPGLSDQQAALLLRKEEPESGWLVSAQGRFNIRTQQREAILSTNETEDKEDYTLGFYTKDRKYIKFKIEFGEPSL